MKLNLSILAAVLAFSSTASSAETMYKCANPEGGISYQASPCVGGKELASKPMVISSMQEDKSAESTGTATAYLGGGNGYFLDTLVNGSPIKMQVDTGAYSVAISADMARSAGIPCITNGAIASVNGISRACKSVITTLKLGTITLKYVDVVILPSLGTGALLGQTALKRLRVEQSGNKITLSSIGK